MKHLTLKQARLARQWTQQELADRSGVPQARISQLEAGVTRDPLNDTARKLEEALSVPRGTLVFGEMAEKIASA